jgi:tetrahedral aminopeptidase
MGGSFRGEMRVDLAELLGRLSEAVGISGYETEVRSLIVDEFQRHADDVRADAMGSVIALKRGQGIEPRRSIMLAAHLDEIGLIVTEVKEGFLHFTTVGGFDARVLLGQPVVAHGKRKLPGVIGSRPPHVLSAAEREKVVPREELCVDVGLPAADVEKSVAVGDLISIRGRYLRLRGDMVAGKAFDDRAGVAALVVCLDMLSGLKHTWDAYVVATSQEEVGLRGATTSAYGVAPDLGIAIDVGFGPQPGVPDSESVPIGKGPALAIGPNIHPGMLKKLEEVAKAAEIPYSVEAAPGATGTDAWAIQVAREGVPTCLLSVPVRNMHTPVETASLKDITRTGRLLALFVAALDDRFMDQIAWPLGQ